MRPSQKALFIGILRGPKFSPHEKIFSSARKNIFFRAENLRWNYLVEE
ncbi:hypothetical protein PORCRE_1480 [Porphyromonas crevioricanis JCM 15906]|uniref:Uncharacterized protein n=1 Tax=Porphyromonas crevioricanis JCM 15906 TaxID=1305617 RepID=T1CPL5_9PORP|nr:hypothetical protein PORCRE_1480 [Porphyromonas crevioricanis JCM 15906]